MKNLRKIAAICTFLFVVVAIVGSVYGISGDANSLKNAIKGTGSKDASTVLTNKVTGIWNTIATVVQILAVAAVVFAGVRYMFASADAKADIKKQTVILIVGAVLVFGATAILGLVAGTANDLL